MTGPEAPPTAPAALEAASDLLERLLLQVTTVPGQAVRTALVREMRRAARQVARLREGSLDESETFTQLRTAQACVERLRLRLEQLGESAAPLAATAAVVGEALTRHRREAITQAVAGEAAGSTPPESD
ncbi:MAG: hypothetical protein JRI68_17725 [Deltaproteobacteria bacterium]|nr:hypothetical protein [Deltaproteobacteria bacterium]